MRFDITNEHLRVHPGRFVQTDLMQAHPVASGVPGLQLVAIPARIKDERGNHVDHGSAEVFMVVPAGEPSAADVVGLERRITLLLHGHDLYRGTDGAHLTVWMPNTLVKDLVAHAA